MWTSTHISTKTGATQKSKQKAKAAIVVMIVGISCKKNHAMRYKVCNLFGLKNNVAFVRPERNCNQIQNMSQIRAVILKKKRVMFLNTDILCDSSIFTDEYVSK